jgi:nucleotide-binding universal stress UspA family protein
MYKRVLVATGGSPWSDAAVSYAIAWAACRGAELRILSVLASPVAYTMPDVMSSSELLIASIERQGQELLDRVAAQAERAGVSYTALLKWGNVSETILQTAVEEDCDLITLGSRVVTGLKRLVVGRTLNAVAAKAQRPVLIIKHPPDPRAGLALWRRILVATGGSPWSDVAVDHALHLARALDLAVCLLTRAAPVLPSPAPRLRPRTRSPWLRPARLLLVLPTKHIWAMGISPRRFVRQPQAGPVMPLSWGRVV